MKFSQLPPVELAEYLFLLLSFLSLPLAFIFHWLILPFFPLLATVALNLINRRRGQLELSKKLSHHDQKLKKLLEEQSPKKTLMIKSEVLDNFELEVQPKPIPSSLKLSPERKPVSWQYADSFRGHEQAVTSLDISEDGKFLASVSWDRQLKIWDLETGKCLDQKVAHDQGILAVSLSQIQPGSNHYWLATGGFDQKIKLWRFSPQEREVLRLKAILTNHCGSIHALAIARERGILISGSYDQTLKQWQLDTGELRTSSFDELGAIYALARCQDLIVAGGGDGSLTIWQLGSGEMLAMLVGNISSVISVAFSQDGEWVAAGCVDGQIRFWQLPPLVNQPLLEPRYTFKAHAGQVTAIHFAPEGTLLSVGADGCLQIRQLTDSQPLQIITQETQRLFSLALSPEQRLLAIGNMEGTIKLWSKYN